MKGLILALIGVLISIFIVLNFIGEFDSVDGILVDAKVITWDDIGDDEYGTYPHTMVKLEGKGWYWFDGVNKEVLKLEKGEKYRFYYYITTGMSDCGGTELNYNLYWMREI